MESNNSVSKSNWQKTLIQYLKQNFSKKNNISRLICFVIGLVIVLVPSLTCNLMVRNGSWTENVIYNDGIAFSFLRGKVAVVYVLQSLICVLVFVAILFTDKWYLTILLSLAFFGGMFNLLDRATQYLSPTNISGWAPDTVIDYLPTFNTTSNLPDVFILTGVIGFSVLYVITTIINVANDKKQNKKDGDKTQDEKNHS